MQNVVKDVETLENHELSTLPLRDLLSSAGRPVTRQEKNVLASLARAYEQMGHAFPNPYFGEELDLLYSQALATADAARSAVGPLLVEHTDLFLQTKGLSPARTTPKKQEKAIRAYWKAFHELERELDPVYERSRQLRFLALKSAAQRINAAVKAKRKS